ncbi:MAG: choice-of-anchor D domain-containing protein, partial [Myxococcales bacterium]
EEKLIASSCREDSHCTNGFLCEDFQCVPAETKSCEVVIEGNPILQPQPYSVSFGELDTEESTQTLTLHNIGNCTLTLFEAALTNKDGSPFSSDLLAAKFPVEIFPGRSRQFSVTFKGSGVGTFADDLLILSDDREFPELKVPLRATFLGVPELRVLPNPVDFGYVAQGRHARKAMQITNQGTGTAPLTVLSVTLDPKENEDFELQPEPNEQVVLAPTKADAKAVLPFELVYHPRSNAQHESHLVVVTNKGEVRVKLSGNSETPPKLNFNPASLDLGQVPLGSTNFQALTLVNEGGAPLHVQYSWGGPRPTTDLFTVPTVIPPIAPGQYLEIQVGFTATAVGKIEGLLVLASDDPARPSVTLPVHAEGIAGAGPQVVKLEMTFDNGADGAFDKDLRNVDMSLEHPFGYVCNKQNPNPTNWGAYGN